MYTSEYKGSEDTKSQTVVVKKMLQVLDQEEKKLFYKEIKLLNDLHHPNIVRLKGISLQPLAIMLEYIYFDFKHFGCDGVRVHSLSDFLLQIDEFNCEGLFKLVSHAAKEIVNGLMDLTLHIHRILVISCMQFCRCFAVHTLVGKYFVAAKDCKRQLYECTLHRDHVACTCPSHSLRRRANARNVGLRIFHGG